MTTCPKCGSDFIRGPRYVSSGCGSTHPRDRLVYTCERCGFQMSKPTLDQNEPLARGEGQ